MEIHRSVSGFFYEAVTDALKTRHMDVGETTEFYLVNLLSEYATTTAVPELMADEPIALKLAAAAEQPLEDRRRTLKSIGDGSLYMTGFFGDSLARKLVDIDYYMTLGGSAYSRLAALVGTEGISTRQVYGELGERFREFVSVLEDIRAATTIGTSTNVLRLYEQWMETGSDWAERRLRATGLLDATAFDPDKPAS